MLEDHRADQASFKTSLWQGDPILHVKGELDIASAKAFDDALAAFSSGAHLIVDLREVEYIDSTGLGALVKHTKRIGIARGDVRLLVATSTVRRVLNVCGLDSYFVIADSLEDLP